jgi:hypothetical protein
VFIQLILIVPPRIVELLLPFYYRRAGVFIITVLLVIMPAISMFLFRHFCKTCN